jgi:predicted RND superfamily exporter protein
MSETKPGTMERIFRVIVAWRWGIVAFYTALLAPAAWYASGVRQDNSVDTLLVESDPDFQANRAFVKQFGGGEYVVLFAEARDPFSPEVIARVDEIESAVGGVSKVMTNSILTVFRRAKAGFDPATQARELEDFARGSSLFEQQGLVGRGFLTIPIVLDVHGPAERTEMLARIDEAVAPFVANPAPLTALRRVGQPYVAVYLDEGTTQAGMRCFPFFGLFVTVLCLWLYRSFRALAAFVITLAVNVCLTMGFVGMIGGTFTIVSALVPMTVLITCTANLVYIHTRFVERPAERSVEDHHVFALANKFVACTASIFATAVGFAALAVSDIRPIREMGIWVAVGLVFTWVLVFTLFPALQRILRTPTQIERKTAGQWFLRLVAWLPRFSYRWRWWLVPGSLVLCAFGLIALFGMPGAIQPMSLETDQIAYISKRSELYRDTKRLEDILPGLAVTTVWLKGKVGSLEQPGIIRGLDRFQTKLEADPMIGSVVGPTTVLRLLRYAGGHGDRLPEDPDELEMLTDSFSTLASQDPVLVRFIESASMSQAYLTLLTPSLDYEGYRRLDALVQRHWRAQLAADPDLRELDVRTVGLAALQAKMAHNLVPTLVESFALTVVIIFSAFLIVFRSGAARLMAMIPSLFAILVMFLVMRIAGTSLNVATILIASTVLGTSENDQIHFFYHFLERQKTGTTEDGLRHTMLIAGKSIFFATLINAGGFLAFALSPMPPMYQFALLAALAFVLSMIADFTALPAALWMVFRDKPDALKPPA